MTTENTLSNLINDDQLEDVSRTLKAISHPTRLRILCELADGEKNVQYLNDTLGTSQPNISQHLSILKNEKIISSRKDSNKVYYNLSSSRAKALLSSIDNIL